ncbi:MAG TPA: YicC/YloC family endoribonuclease [Ignavibacteriaceae bacterium]|nr:YicC/YloC family endoribonuclease [Ignavibacteriaceae bacterium]
MLYSMTGYGKGLAENEKISVEVEVKSVNSRFLDIYLKLPNSLMNKDYELRELIKNKIKRGKLTVIVQIKINGSENELPQLDKIKLKNQISIIKDIKKVAKLSEKIKLENILSNKDIYTTSDLELSEQEFQLLKEALNKALDQLSKMKKDEGKELEKDLFGRLKNIENVLSEIEKESAEGGIKEYYEKLKERVKILLDGQTADNDRLELELAIMADKSDITEESVRLRSHIKFFKESLETDSEPGRKVNFLCQELNREANTISSKSVLTSITHRSVLIKEEIEKIREQIQNIE